MSRYFSRSRFGAPLQVFLMLIALGVTRGAWASEVKSGDAYARFDEPTKTWTIGTSLVEEKLQFLNGNFALISLGE